MATYLYLTKELGLVMRALTVVPKIGQVLNLEEIKRSSVLSGLTTEGIVTRAHLFPSMDCE